MMMQHDAMRYECAGSGVYVSVRDKWCKDAAAVMRSNDRAALHRDVLRVVVRAAVHCTHCTLASMGHHLSSSR